MKKRSTVIVLFSFLLFAFTASILADDVRSEEAVHNSVPAKNEDPVIIVPSVTELALLYNNGPFVSAPGGGPGGSDGSVLVSPMSTLGFGHATTTAFRIADDFEVPVDEIWQIDSIVFYGYQTGSSTTSTFTAVNYRVWSGNPGTGTIVFGDTATNRMTATYFTNCYRYSSTAVGTTRPIMANQVSAGFSLNQGTYWLDWASAGTLTSGPWAPPITISGQQITGNAFQRDPNLVWNPANDNGTLARQGFPFKIYGTKTIVPVELTSFVASVIGDKVQLDWTTATELNNKGFEIQRANSDNQFVTVGFVNGKGTTTHSQSYSYSDKNLAVGKYFYRLKQVDFDGGFEYSNVIEVEIVAPSVFSLEQNYPNPFNPSTKISFSVAVDSKVDIKLFNILGQEIASIFNGNVSAGYRTITLDASNLMSGVYLYKLDAKGVDGTEFSSIKKMILSK